MTNWLKIELKFITWLYKYNNFHGTLKIKEFREFSTKEEAVNQFEQELGVKYNE